MFHNGEATGAGLMLTLICQNNREVITVVIDLLGLLKALLIISQDTDTALCIQLGLLCIMSTYIVPLCVWYVIEDNDRFERGDDDCIERE